jgi:outer membrane protein assembly factor BamB
MLKTNQSFFVLALVSALIVSGCSTVSDTASRLNPFDGDGAQESVAPTDGRISILSFEQSLQADPSARAVTLPTAYANTVWPQPDGYPTHAMEHTQASGPLEIVWRRSFGEGSGRNRRLNARPVAAEGRIYVMDGQGVVNAMDADTGERVWQRRLRSGSRRDRMSFGGGLAYDGGRIYAHAGYRFMVALDATSGAEIWRTDSLTPFHSAPTVAGGRVYAATDDNELYALDSENGSVLWTHQGIVEPARLITSPSAAVLGDVVVVPYASGEIYALRVENGNPLWNDALTRTGGLTPISEINDVAGSPVIAGDTVYVMNHSGLMAALELRSGERIWNQPAGGLNAPWVAGDYLFLVTTEGEVVCMERATGAIVWIQQLPVFENPNDRDSRIAWSGPVLAGGRLFLASSNGDAAILSATDGTIQRRFRLGDDVYVAPIIVNETIYVVTNEARLIALR